jgi:hypothetical protein
LRELSKKECAEVSGGGAFSCLTSVGFLALSVGVSFIFAGPAGAAATVTLWGLGTGVNVIYDAANKDRESKRVENYDYSKSS